MWDLTRNIAVRDLVEGMEVCTHGPEDRWQIVEDATTENGRTTVLLIDGRSITLPANALVTVGS